MAESKMNGIVENMLSGLDTALSTKTVVGEATKIGDTIIVPFVDVSFGMGVGAFGNDKKDNGAGGLTGKITPSAVLVIQNGSTRLVNIKNQDAITKVLDMVPDVMNKITAKKEQTVSDDEAVKNAFPNE